MFHRRTAFYLPPLPVQVSRDEVTEMVVKGALTPQLQAIWDTQAARQKAVQQLCTAVAAGDLAAAEVRCVERRLVGGWWAVGPRPCCVCICPAGRFVANRTALAAGRSRRPYRELPLP